MSALIPLSEKKRRLSLCAAFFCVLHQRGLNQRPEGALEIRRAFFIRYVHNIQLVVVFTHVSLMDKETRESRWTGYAREGCSQAGRLHNNNKLQKHLECYDFNSGAFRKNDKCLVETRLLPLLPLRAPPLRKQSKRGFVGLQATHRLSSEREFVMIRFCRCRGG